MRHCRLKFIYFLLQLCIYFLILMQSCFAVGLFFLQIHFELAKQCLSYNMLRFEIRDNLLELLELLLYFFAIHFGLFLCILICHEHFMYMLLCLCLFPLQSINLHPKQLLFLFEVFLLLIRLRCLLLQLHCLLLLQLHYFLL